MQDNRIPVPKDDRFMVELIRQIDQLPTPASLSGRDEDRIKENMRILEAIRTVLKKRCRRQALLALLLNAVLLAVAYAVVFMLVLPEVSYASPAVQTLMTWRYTILGVFSLGILAYSLYRAGLYWI